MHAMETTSQDPYDESHALGEKLVASSFCGSVREADRALPQLGSERKQRCLKF